MAKKKRFKKNTVLEVQKFDLTSYDPLKGHVPIQSLEDLHYYVDAFLSNTIIISNIMKSREDYLKQVIYLQNVIMSCFEQKDCRMYPVTFKFYPHSTKTYTMAFRDYVFHLILWIPFVRFPYYPDLMTEDCIFTEPEKNIPGDAFDNWRNLHIIDRIREEGLTTEYLNVDFSEMHHRIAMFGEISFVFGTTYGLIDVYEFQKDPVIGKIIHGIEDIKRPTAEIEEEIRNNEKVLVSRIMDKFPSHPLTRMIKSGGIVKTKQLLELLGVIGYRSGFNENTIPIPIRTGYLNGGAVSPSHIFADTNGAYKSLINNKEVMGPIGHFVRSLTMICETLHLDTDCYDCGTRYLMPYKITNQKVLKMLVNKYYLANKDSDEYDYVKITDTHLIGKTIWTRSIITCAAGHNSCCHMCLGKNSHTMSVLYSIGAFLGEEAGKNLEQNILSTKHLLITNSVGILIEGKDNIFQIVEAEIFINQELEQSDLVNLAIQIDMDSLEKMDDMDDDSLYNTYINNGHIQVIHKDTGVVDDIYFKLPDAEVTKEDYIPPIYLDPDILAIVRRTDGYIDLIELEPDQRIFVYDVINNEVAKKIYALKRFLWNSCGRRAGDIPLEQLGNIIMDYFINALVTADAIAGEVIINRLIRSVSDPYHRPNFKSDTLEMFVLSSIQDCLKKNASISTGLAFQDTRRQILADNLDERTEVSDNDAYFREYVEIPKKYKKMMSKGKLK